MNDMMQHVPILSGSSKNPKLPFSHVKVSIKGKHKQKVFLDPRRIRPLPENPRMRSSPGFSPESLRELGQSIKISGQMQAAKVCTIKKNPDFDAQLIDGERRHLSCKLFDLMIECEVDEEIDGDNIELLHVLSTISNFHRYPHTSLETAFACKRMVEQAKMSVEEVAKALGHQPSWVYTHMALLKLSPIVQDYLVTPPDTTTQGPGRKRESKLSFQVATMLVELPEKEQVSLSKYIIEKEMGDTEARRLILNRRREKGLPATSRRGRPRELFISLERLVDRSEHSFGIFLDMHPNEILSMIDSHNTQARETLSKELQYLASCLGDIANMIAGKRPNGIPSKK